MGAIEQLHEQVFGFIPEKPGTAYERVTAIALAVMSWQEVTHDTRVAGAGRRAKHQLDVTARSSDGAVRRLIVECKAGDDRVGKGEMDTLVGVRSQLGADAAALMTVAGFTRGARAVADDEGVAMIVLRPFEDPDDWEGFVKTVRIKIRAYGSQITRMEPMITQADALERLLAGRESVPYQLELDARLVRSDGSLAETIEEILSPHRPRLVEGEFELEAIVPPDRYLQVFGERLPLAGFRWTEVSGFVESESVTRGRGEPVLRVDEIDMAGDPLKGRLIVDRDLHAWDIDATGRVVERGPLLPPDPTA